MLHRQWVVALVLGLHAAAAASDKQAIVSWDTLAQVSVVREQSRYVPQFTKEITALDRKEVRLQGFMTPLDPGGKQKRFLLSAMPSSCPYCLPGSADQFVEVQAKRAVEYMTEPLIVSGRFALVRDDAGGLLYRLTDAVVIEK